MWLLLRWWLILLTGAVACSTSDGGDSGTVSDSTTPPPPNSQPQSRAVDPGNLSSWQATAYGWGLVRAGMTLAEAARVAGAPTRDTTNLMSECDYVSLQNAPADVLFMVIQGRIARVDIGTPAVTTTEGATVGDSEARITDLYADRLVVERHHYDERGHYMVVRAALPADSLYRLVFETDGARVTRYRSGLLPAVKWIEGCS